MLSFSMLQDRIHSEDFKKWNNLSYIKIVTLKRKIKNIMNTRKYILYILSWHLHISECIGENVQLGNLWCFSPYGVRIQSLCILINKRMPMLKAHYLDPFRITIINFPTFADYSFYDPCMPITIPRNCNVTFISHFFYLFTGLWTIKQSLYIRQHSPDVPCIMLPTSSSTMKNVFLQYNALLFYSDINFYHINDINCSSLKVEYILLNITTLYYHKTHAQKTKSALPEW